jgi:hypothetical protein
LQLGVTGTVPSNGDYLDGYDLFDNSEEVDISFILGAAANQTRATDLIDNVAGARLDCIASSFSRKQTLLTTRVIQESKQMILLPSVICSHHLLLR